MKSIFVLRVEFGNNEHKDYLYETYYRALNASIYDNFEDMEVEKYATIFEIELNTQKRLRTEVVYLYSSYDPAFENYGEIPTREQIWDKCEYEQMFMEQELTDAQICELLYYRERLPWERPKNLSTEGWYPELN